VRPSHDLDWPHKREYDRKFEDLASATDDVLLEVGTGSAKASASRTWDFGRVAQGFVESDTHPTTE
jgi:hypothetical protein